MDQCVCVGVILCVYVCECVCVCACVLMLSVGRGACSLNGAERNCGHLCSPCQTQTLRGPLFQRGDWPRTSYLAERQKQALTAGLVVTDSQELPTWHGTAS